MKGLPARAHPCPVPVRSTCQLDNQIEAGTVVTMKQVSLAEFKAHFSGWLDAVRQGERIAIQYGRRKEIVAILVPPAPMVRGLARRLGVLKGKAQFRIGPGFKMTEADLIEA